MSFLFDGGYRVCSAGPAFLSPFSMQVSLVDPKP